jgi:hypothetical protein
MIEEKTCYVSKMEGKKKNILYHDNTFIFFLFLFAKITFSVDITMNDKYILLFSSSDKKKRTIFVIVFFFLTNNIYLTF